MRKTILWLLAGLIFILPSTSRATGNITARDETSPDCITTTTTTTVPYACSINIDLSNELPDGTYYGTVGLALLPNACSRGYDGVQIVVDANQNLLIPKSNFGIQKFGFNYSGDPGELVITTNGKWDVSNNKNISEFGRFNVVLSSSGSKRQDPLVIKICNTKRDLTEEDFAIGNQVGYVFAVHIADFIYPGYPRVQSAYFSTMKTCSNPTTTTTVSTTSTTTPPPATTTTAEMPTTTTTVPEIPVTTSIIIPVTTTSVPTTVIDMSVFKAMPGNGKVTLIWLTESEIDNQGFNIYRGETEDEEYEKINEQLIAARGSETAGAVYTITDDGLTNRKTYYYKIEDVDSSGFSTFHGPVSATPRFILGIFNQQENF